MNLDIHSILESVLTKYEGRPNDDTTRKNISEDINAIMSNHVHYPESDFQIKCSLVNEKISITPQNLDTVAILCGLLPEELVMISPNTARIDGDNALFFFNPTHHGILPLHLLDTVRPWGKFEVTFSSKAHLVKTITVNPHGRLSLQSHKFRSEHWRVMSGEGLMEVEGHEYVIKEDHEVMIHPGDKHRVSNTHESELLVIEEVQFGHRLDESDITRYEDDYGR